MQIEVKFTQDDELKIQNYLQINSVIITTPHNFHEIGFIFSKLSSNNYTANRKLFDAWGFLIPFWNAFKVLVSDSYRPKESLWTKEVYRV